MGREPTATTTATKHAQALARRKLFTRGFTLVMVASLLYNSGFQLTGAALPLFAVSLGASDIQVGLMIGVFALAAMLGRTIVGWQLDRGGKRFVLAAGNAIFVISALGYAVVGSIGPLLGLRTLNGAGHAAGQAAAQTLAAETAPPERRGEALSLQTMTIILAVAVMPALGIAIAGLVDFRGLFLVAGSLSLVAAVVALFCPEPPVPDVRAPAVFFNRDSIRPGLILFALMAGFGVTVSLAPVHATRVGLTNPGLFFLAYALGALMSQSFGGRLSDRRGRAAAIVPGLGLATIGLWGVGLAQAWWILPAAATFGAGLGLAQPNLFALAVDYVAPNRRGSVLASTGMFLEGGISVGATLGGIIGQFYGLGVAFVVLGSLSGVALVVLVATAWGRQTLTPPPR